MINRRGRGWTRQWTLGNAYRNLGIPIEVLCTGKPVVVFRIQTQETGLLPNRTLCSLCVVEQWFRNVCK
jgi:hypothetical protein